MDKNTFVKYVKPNLKRGEVKIVKELLNVPVRPLSKKVLEYIKQHPVYLTLTSSPTRLRKSTTTLAILLQNEYITKVFVTLPELYRNKEKYKQSDIKFVASLDPRIEILRVKDDIGPITKMLPTLELVQDPDAIVISVDDDIGYPASLINELIWYSVKCPDVIFTGAGFRWGDEGYPDSNIDRKKWPVFKKPRYPFVDIVEGWGAIAYKSRLLNLELMKKLSKLDITCKLSDDLIISFVLAKQGVKMKVIVNDYYQDQGELYSFDYGLQGDALHKGSGLDKGDVDNANIIKYKKCLEFLQKYK